LLPQNIKATDSRAASFQRRFGNNAATVELDALPSVELRRRVDKAVSGLVDLEQWNRQVFIQQVKSQSGSEICDRLILRIVSQQGKARIFLGGLLLCNQTKTPISLHLMAQLRALFRNGGGFVVGFCVRHVNHPFLRGFQA
jgi:hypothetical protein